MLQPHDKIKVTYESSDGIDWYGHDKNYQYFYTFAEKDKNGDPLGNYVLWIGMKEHFDRWANSRDFMLVIPHRYSWDEILQALEIAIEKEDYDSGWAKEQNLELYLDPYLSEEE